MRARRGIGLAAAAVLCVLLLLRNSPRELPERVGSLLHYAPMELPVRRLGGSSAAFDRRFFIFLESARRRIPTGTVGVAIYGPPPSDQVLYLASYHLAPIPVLVSPRSVPPRWIAAVYGREVPPGWRLIASVSDGALLEPSR